jgi:hypothetical protein
MSLAGRGAVAIWHDIVPEGLDEFYAWHGQEHMRERVGIRGFLRGRRYLARRGDLQFFNLYEARSPEVLTGPDYQARLNNPTPWTASTIKHFRRVSRAICKVAASMGNGQGGLVSTWRYDVAAEGADAHIDALSRQVLPNIARHGIVAGAHLLVADEGASSVGTAESKARAEANKVPRWVVIVEGWGDEAPFAELCEGALSGEVLDSTGVVGPVAFGLYQLQVTVDQTNLVPASDGRK